MLQCQRVLALSILVPASLSGCSLFGSDGDGGDDPTTLNIEMYEQVRLSLEEKRRHVLPAAMVDDVQSSGPYLTWLDIYGGFEGVLHIRDMNTESDILATAPIGGEGISPNYLLSDEIAITALSVGDDAIYTTIDLASGDTLDTVVLAKPEGAKYDAYSAYENRAYVVVEDEGKMIYEWTAGSGAPTAIGALDDTGISLGAWAGFFVVEFGGSRNLIAIGTYGTYAIDLATMDATQVPLPILALESAVSSLGMAAVEGDELWWYAWGEGAARPLHEEIMSSGYEFNSTYATMHWPGVGTSNFDLAVKGSTIYYRGRSTVFSYDVESGDLGPILLDDQTYDGGDTNTTYTGLHLGDPGLYVIGLESPSGSTGADGPVYLVTL